MNLWRPLPARLPSEEDVILITFLVEAAVITWQWIVPRSHTDRIDQQPWCKLTIDEKHRKTGKKWLEPNRECRLIVNGRVSTVQIARSTKRIFQLQNAPNGLRQMKLPSRSTTLPQKFRSTFQYIINRLFSKCWKLCRKVNMSRIPTESKIKTY